MAHAETSGLMVARQLCSLHYCAEQIAMCKCLTGSLMLVTHVGSQVTAKERRLIALAAQRAQDAQTGYCADYCSKSQPMGFAEIKEFQKGA